MPTGAITLFHLRGIRVSADYSWFVILFLIIWLLSGSFRDELGAGDDSITPYLLAVASALLFFGSILLHELGHAVIAIRNGIGIEGITLWMFGGVARLDRDSDSPGTEFKVAIAGPVVTALIVAGCIGVGALFIGGDGLRDAAPTEGGSEISAGAALVSWLAAINLFVLLFNLVPAYPLDGGRIARAIAWRITGSRGRATRIAATLGRGFAYLLIGGGGVLLLLGDPLNGIWLIIIGFILNGAARGAIAQTEITDRLEGVSVGDVMDREPVALPERLTVERALDEFFLRYGWPWFPVIDGSARFIGLLDRATAEEVDSIERASRTVGEVLARDEGSLTIREDAPLEAALGNEALRRLGALMAIDGDGRLSGVITTDAIGRAMREPAAEA
jgi:Zn-dependent protease